MWDGRVAIFVQVSLQPGRLEHGYQPWDQGNSVKNRLPWTWLGQFKPSPLLSWVQRIPFLSRAPHILPSQLSDKERVVHHSASRQVTSRVLSQPSLIPGGRESLAWNLKLCMKLGQVERVALRSLRWIQHRMHDNWKFYHSCSSNLTALNSFWKCQAAGSEAKWVEWHIHLNFEPVVTNICTQRTSKEKSIR